jgi:hypothetical protein
MKRAAVLVVLAAFVVAPGAAALAACSPADLDDSSAVRCVQAPLKAVNRCRRAGTPLSSCEAQVSSAACDLLPSECRPAAQIYSILATTQRPGRRGACRSRLARAALKVLKRGLARARAGGLSALSNDLATCNATALGRCDAVPELGPPCAGLAAREDAAACVCGLALPVLPASVEFLPGACPSRLAGTPCATASGSHLTCHEAFAVGGGDVHCVAGHEDRAGFQPPTDGGGSVASSFPIRPRGRVFHTRHPEATGAVSVRSTALGPAGSIVGASDQGNFRLTAPTLTSRVVVLRWQSGDLPAGASSQVRLTAGSRVLADVTRAAGAPAADQVTALLSWVGDLDLTISALASARRDLPVPSADVAWRLSVLDPTADDDVDGTPNARDLAPLDRNIPAEPAPSSRPRVLLIGLDGAGWDVLDPLIDAGYLPTIGGLIRGGAWAKLDETANGPNCCYCPPVWSSIATGWPRTVHGMFQLADEPLDRAVPAIWTILAAHGGTTTQVSYRNTFPVEPGVTYDVSEQGLLAAANQIFDAQNSYTSGEDLDRLELTWPPLLFESLGLLPVTAPRVKAWIPLAVDRVSVEALARLAATSPTDLTMWILHSIDKTEHQTWHEVQPLASDPLDEATLLTQAADWTGPVTGPCCSLAAGGWKHGNVASQFLEADQHVARVLGTAHYDYVIFASDHSMTRNPGTEGPVGVHVIPPTFDGVFAISGPGIVPGLDMGSVSLLDVAPTLAYLLDLPVADDLPGSVITAAFDPDHLTANPISRVATWTTP